jgi:acetolactate decarboxylase
MRSSFEATQNTLYQVSTATALVEGVYQGAVSIGTLRGKGDHGLGTFAGLDGEMVVLEGHLFQVKCDGSVREVMDDVMVPFAAITRFSPETGMTLDRCDSLNDLTSHFDKLRDSENVFYALKVRGLFEHMHTRAMCRTPEGARLIQAAAVQPEFEFRKVHGTLVGFWTPEYARTLNIPGYHLHFLSDDHSRGGHVLGCAGANLSFQIQRENNYHIAFPETLDFLKADLRRDPAADLAKAEGITK